MTVRELQKFQKSFDAEFNPDETKTDQIRTATAELAQVISKLTICNRSQNQERRDCLRQEVIPELLTIALRFANLCDSELESLYFNKLLEINYAKQKERLLTLSKAPA